MNESYAASLARMADEYAAENGWTEADLDDDPPPPPPAARVVGTLAMAV